MGVHESETHFKKAQANQKARLRGVFGGGNPKTIRIGDCGFRIETTLIYNPSC